MGRKLFCIPLCAEPNKGVEAIQMFQAKVEPVANGLLKVSVTTPDDGHDC